MSNILTFGGFSPNNNTFQQNTWQFAINQWIQVSTPLVPITSRSDYTIVYFSTNNSTLLFGGRNTSTYYNDLYQWDGTTWTPIVPLGTAPSVRSGMGACDVTGQSFMIFFGGVAPNSGPNAGYVFKNDTFQLSYNSGIYTWLQISSVSDPVIPNARTYGSLAFEPVMNLVILFGGQQNSTPLTVTNFMPLSPLKWASGYMISIPPQPASKPSLSYDRHLPALVNYVVNDNVSYVYVMVNISGGLNNWILCTVDPTSTNLPILHGSLTYVSISQNHQMLTFDGRQTWVLTVTQTSISPPLFQASWTQIVSQGPPYCTFIVSCKSP
jgi:hypothetical protein